MGRLRCPKCGHTFEADPAVARCPNCAWAPSRVGAPAQPVPSRPVFAPAAAPLPASAPPAFAAPPQPAPPAVASKLAVWALVCALAPLGLYILSTAALAFSGPSGGVFSPFGGILGLAGLAGPIAGIALGIAARRDPTTSQGGRSMALAAIIIGCVTLGMYVLAFLFLLILIATCGAACGSASSSQGSSCLASPAALMPMPCVAGLTALPTRAPGRLPLRDAFAHHPDLPALRADVLRVAGLRLCVGCFTVYPVFVAALLATWAWPVPSGVAWSLGALLAAAQLVSVVGWARWRWLKVAVKACLGAGAALLLQAVAVAPWPPLVKSLAVAAAGLAAYASGQPRLRRLARLQAAA